MSEKQKGLFVWGVGVLMWCCLV